jgi:lipopolysaccharide transport system permease protein
MKHRRIEATSGWAALNLAEFWDYRELVWFFGWRDLKVRYRQTLIGASWAIIQPLFAMAVLSLFFGRLAKVPSDGVPYPLFSYAGLVPWTFFAATLAQASNSLVSNPDMLKKIYFPRLTLPVASVLAGLVDLLLALLVLLALMAFYGVVPSMRALWLPAVLLVGVAASLGAGLWLSSLNVEFRDVRYVVPFLTQMLMFATPVAYPSSMLDEFWRPFYAINPMAGVVEGVRWSLLGTPTHPGSMLIVSGLVATGLLVSGAYWFRRMERTFADIA